MLEASNESRVFDRADKKAICPGERRGGSVAATTKLVLLPLKQALPLGHKNIYIFASCPTAMARLHNSAGLVITQHDDLI